MPTCLQRRNGSHKQGLESAKRHQNGIDFLHTRLTIATTIQFIAPDKATLISRARHFELTDRAVQKGRRQIERKSRERLDQFVFVNGVIIGRNRAANSDGQIVEELSKIEGEKIKSGLSSALCLQQISYDFIIKKKMTFYPICKVYGIFPTLPRGQATIILI